MEIAAKLLQKKVRIKTIVLNSSPLDLKDVKPFWQLAARFLQRENKVIKALWQKFQNLSPKLLVGKASANPKDPDLEINRGELQKIARSLQ